LRRARRARTPARGGRPTTARLPRRRGGRRRRARLRARVRRRPADRVCCLWRLRSRRRREHRLRLPARRARRAGDRARGRDPRRAPALDRGDPTALRSSQRAAAVVTTPIHTAPFAPARWKLAPGRTVLLVIDPQNDFLHEEGWYAKQGIDIGHMRRILQPTTELVAEARRKGVSVVWTRHGYADAAEAGPFLELRPFLKDGGLRRGTWGWELYDALDVRPEDTVVEKNRLSAFFNTNLEEVLRDLGAETVLI